VKKATKVPPWASKDQTDRIHTYPYNVKNARVMITLQIIM
jgi:hypothetical protein